MMHPSRAFLAASPRGGSPSEGGRLQSLPPFVFGGLGVKMARRKRSRKLGGWSRMTPSLDFNAVEERAERMSPAALRYALEDIRKTKPASRSLDREDGGDREGFYADEASVYRAELKSRKLGGMRRSRKLNGLNPDLALTIVFGLGAIGLGVYLWKSNTPKLNGLGSNCKCGA